LKQKMPARLSPGLLPGAREDDSLPIGAGGENPLQLAAGYDVETRTAPGEDVEHGEVRVGFDRVTDERIDTRQFTLELGERRLQLASGIDPARCPKAVGNLGQ